MMTMNKTKKYSLFLLPLILISYLVVGFPDGAFTVSWVGIEYDLSLSIAHSGYILVGYSITYTLSGIVLGFLNRFFKLQTLYLQGLIIMAVGFLILAFSTGFSVALLGIAVYGFGTGLMASSMNSYMAKHFTAGHNNLMHCFWGAGAAISPLIMAHMMNVSTWSVGYFAIIGILIVVGIILLLSLMTKIWIDEEEIQHGEEEKITRKSRRCYLTKPSHQVIEIMTFFFLGGTDYTLVFFTGMVLYQRGVEGVAILSAVYYISMTAGRMFFGYLAKYLKELSIIRVGIAVAVMGMLTLQFVSSSIGVATLGMALTGFGLGPLLPTLVSDTLNRFRSESINKLVGYEFAAFGAGIAVLFFMTSQILNFVTLEALFPIGLSFVFLVFVCNEILEKAIKRANKELI